MNENSVTVIVDGQMYHVVNDNPVSFESLKDALRVSDEDAVLGHVDKALGIRRHTNGLFYVKNGVVHVENDPLPNALSNRLIDFMDNGLPCDALVKFWKNLKKNPSKDSVEQLYPFLEHNNIPITSDGCFIAYKRVTEDYKDVHTKTFDNSPGVIVRMPREDVTADPSMLCSKGLHVAAWPYAEQFYPNGILVEVKVNPKDVVSVPADYEGQKMRVCEYEVLGERAKKRDEIFVEDADWDETADEDVWDDEGGWYDEDCDGYDDTFQDQEDVVPDDTSYQMITPDARGRLTVPASMVRLLGVAPNGIVYVTPDKLTCMVAIRIKRKKIAEHIQWIKTIM